MRRPPTTEHRAPSARAFPSDAWTLDLIRQAEITADTGNLRWAAELCDALQCDDRARAARLQLGGLFGLPLTFEDGVGRLRRRARKAVEVEEDWWSAFSDEALLDLLMWGVVLGVGLARITWVEERGRHVPRLDVWHPRALRWDAYAAAWKVRLFDGSEIPITPGDGTWVLFTPGAEAEPWKHGAWKSISRWWRAKRYALGDWGKHSEQASGLKVATTEDGTDEDRTRLANDLMGAGGDTALALPPGWDLKQLSVASSTVDVFDRLIDAADDATTVALLGQNLTTEVKGGSYSAASVHETVSRTVLRALASSLAGCLRAQVLVPWAVLNWGAGHADAAPWPAWDLSPPTDRKQDAEVLEARTRAAVAMAGQGAPVDWRAFAEAAEIPLRATPAAAPATLSAVTPVLPAEKRALAGQVYVDAVFDAAMKRAPGALDAGILGAVQRAVREARDYETLRAELTSLVKDTDDTDLQELILGAVMCCAGAGAFTAAEP